MAASHAKKVSRKRAAHIDAERARPDARFEDAISPRLLGAFRDIQELTAPQRQYVDSRKYLFAEQLFELQARNGRTPGSAMMAFKRAFPELVEADVVNAIYAVQLSKDKQVIAYMEQFSKGLRERHEASVDRVVEELERLAFSNILDFVRVNPGDGSVDVDLRSIDPASAACISSIRVEDTKFGKRVNVTLYDKAASLQTLARMYGLDRAQRLTLDEIDRMIKYVESQLVEQEALKIIEQSAETVMEEINPKDPEEDAT